VFSKAWRARLSPSTIRRPKTVAGQGVVVSWRCTFYVAPTVRWSSGTYNGWEMCSPSPRRRARYLCNFAKHSWVGRSSVLRRGPACEISSGRGNPTYFPPWRVPPAGRAPARAEPMGLSPCTRPAHLKGGRAFSLSGPLPIGIPGLCAADMPTGHPTARLRCGLSM
jgi:hypothetical protein